jgi:hypothetical protein
MASQPSRAVVRFKLGDSSAKEEEEEDLTKSGCSEKAGSVSSVTISSRSPDDDYK